jgi:hypothetical protein
MQLVVVICLLGMWSGALLIRDRFAGPRFGQPILKFTHALPATLQLVLFAYWALYWPMVVAHLPALGLQLLFAYTFDVLLAWSLRRPYSPSLGPVPIVLSANLFVWFPARDALLYALVIAVALASKALLRSANKHIFNPSVFGLAVAGTLCVLFHGVMVYDDISHALALPPHMSSLILLLALIPQVRLRTTPVAFGAAFAMLAVMFLVCGLTGYCGGPSPWWPPWLLTITLLAGDPATIPSALLPRLLFGLFLGVAFYVVSRCLLWSIGTDFFAKVIPIPLANLLVPAFERGGVRLTARWPHLRRDAGNAAYITAWVSLSVLMLLVGSGV